MSEPQEGTSLEVTVQEFPKDNPVYWLGLGGSLVGPLGELKGTYNIKQVLVKASGVVVLRANLPQPVAIPAVLLSKTGEPAEFRLWTDIEADLKTAADKALVMARREEGFRRLRTIEIDWGATDVQNAFLDGRAPGAAVKLNLRGEAKLDLRGFAGPNAAAVDVVAEFRACATVRVTLSSGPPAIERGYAIVCRFGVNAAATLALDLDDFNLSVPEIKLPSLDLSKDLKLPIPTGGQIQERLAGAFARFGKTCEVTHTWTPADPQLVIKRSGQGFHLALMKAGLQDVDYALTKKPDLAHLAVLDAVLSVPSATATPRLTVTATGVQLAIYEGGAIFEGKVKGDGRISLDGTPRRMGPLEISWKEAFLAAESGAIRVSGVLPDDPKKLPSEDDAPADTIARASVEFTKLRISLVDDPSTVLALSGTVEITPSGTRVVELRLEEPYPFELVEKGACMLFRGAQKILQVLAQLKPQPGDLEKLQEILRVIGRIAAAVARAAVFVAESIAEVAKDAAELLALAAVKLGEMVLELLRGLAKLLPSADPAKVAIDIELRIALEPLELRQVMITLGGSAVPDNPQKIEALGFTLEVDKDWRPGLLIDLVSEPGAYLLASRVSGHGTFATLSTDLWLDRPAPQDSRRTVAPVRDASPDDGGRSEKPLLQLVASTKKDDKSFVLVVAGLRRGEAVFFQRALHAARDRTVTVHDGTSAKLTVVNGSFKLEPLTLDMIEVDVKFEADRILPLLGMGEAGQDTKPAPNEFLDKLKKSLGQVVSVKGTLPPEIKDKRIVVGLQLEIKAAGVRTEVTILLELDLQTLEMKLRADANKLTLRSQRIEQKALGLTWVIEQRDEGKRKANEEVGMFDLAFSGGESGFALNKAEARMELRFDGLSGDGQGVVLEVQEFQVNRGGLDLVAKVTDRPVRMNGLDVPFRFNSGGFVIRAGKLVEGAIGGRGTLPPELIGEAGCSVALTFGQGPDGIELQSGKVEIDKKGEPIVCHSTRFTLTISDLDLGFAKDGGYHFYFLVTGALRFTPKSGEFETGLLQHLGDLEIALERAPLTADARVLARHISFQKALNPKKVFPLFNIFTFELRGFGFHPASPKFEENPAAVNISGQIQFASIGDVMQPKIDFHGLWIAPPKAGESLPRIKADGLGVDLQLAGAVKVRGSVLAVDRETRTVEGASIAPPGYDASGFLGEGELDIPGWGAMQASMGFLEVERKEQPAERKKAFFLYLEKKKMAVEIPTPFWTFWLREAGFGFGYRYTLAAIKDAEKAPSAAALIKILDDASKRQGDLSRFSAWKPDPENDNFTLALRGAFQPYPADKVYDQTREEKAESPFFFDVVAALRSDFTFLMSARGWLGVNYATFQKDTDGLREKPGYRGYLYISVPRSELLARVVADPKGFIGENWEVVKKDSPLRKAVEGTEWSATLYIRPGLFHYELGWPDQLAVRLVDKPNMQVTVRGGMIFRAADDGLLLGYNVNAEALLKFEGRSDGSIGAAISAVLVARFEARVLAYLSWRLQGSLVYGLVSLDARLGFSVEAWMDVDLGFKKFTLRIGFSFSVQFTAAVELAIISDAQKGQLGVGGRVAARVSIQAFGCSLSVGVGFAFNEGRLDEARARVQRFMALSITSEQPDAPPVFAAASGDTTIEKDAEVAEAVRRTPAPEPAKPSPEGLKPPILRSAHGRPIKPTDFWLVLREAGADPNLKPLGPGNRYAYALLVPKEAGEPRGGFYCAPAQVDPGGKWNRLEDKPVHTLEGLPTLANTCRWASRSTKPWKMSDSATDPGRFERLAEAPNDVTARWGAPIPVTGIPEKGFTLAHYFDECFLADTSWEFDELGETKVPRRVAEKWREPKQIRIHERAESLSARASEQRDVEREREQKFRMADAVEHPHDERAFQARSTILTLFLDQFVLLSRHGGRTDLEDGRTPPAHVTDLGLVFYGPVDELLQLARAKVRKHDESSAEEPGGIEVLNPRDLWFDRLDPVLESDEDHDHAVEADGIKLGWRLQMPFEKPKPHEDPEQFLHHYEVLRHVEGGSVMREPLRIKTAATEGTRKADGKVRTLAPDWQFTDTLDADTGVSDRVRRALLPSLGEADAVERGRAWIEAFGTRTEVTITYSVTPVDIAGVRGLPRSFTVDVPRPQTPIRPALGEIRMVQTIVAQEGRQAARTRPDDLDVYLALNDPAWDGTHVPDVKTADDEFKAERIYRLVVDPEDIEPAGHYGSDGSTARVRGPGAWSPQKTADEKRFEVKLDAMTLVGPGKVVEEVLSVEDELVRLPRWARLSRKRPHHQLADALDHTKPDSPGTVFVNMLWAGTAGARRVATRFYLETIVRFTSQKTGKSQDYVSRRVAVPVEHAVRVRTPGRDERIADPALRPEAFEWAVPLALPALGDGQVFAESGFARFRVPSRTARLADLVPHKGVQPPPALQLARDPERRVLTTVRFAAVPDWVSGFADGPHELHGTTIAGFDLHELDLDDLARLDTTGQVLALQPEPWLRARRVARIEQISAETARLVPHGNMDLQGWQAHYPSETCRLQAAREGAAVGQSRPIRSAWYSDRETTPHLPERRPRLRLLPLPPESAISELMRGGKPVQIVASLIAAAKSPAHDLVEGEFERLPRLTLLPVEVHEIEGEEIVTTRLGVAISPVQPFTLESGFTAADLRSLLLRIAWVFTDHDGILGRWLADPTVFDGLTLTLEAQAKDKTRTGRVEIPLDLRSPLHPILEEILAELALKTRVKGADQVYRHFTVMTQPPPQTAAKDLAAFLGTTGAGPDPYGWGVLHTLGCAATVRLFDAAADCFVDPWALAKRIDAVVTSVLARWRSSYDALFARLAGQPFVEVHLKPGADRMAGPFDAMIDGLEEEKATLDLDDKGLAFVQISLRPRPIGVWTYHLQKLRWAALPMVPALGPDEQPWQKDSPPPRIVSVAILVNHKGQDAHVVRARGGPVVQVTGTTESALLPLPLPSDLDRRDADSPNLLLRIASGAAGSEFPELSLSIEWESLETAKGKDALVRRWRANTLLSDASSPLKPVDSWTHVPAPGSDAGTDCEAFERFPPMPPDDWAAAFAKDRGDGALAFAAFKHALRAGGSRDLAFPAPTDYAKVTATYLTWAQRFLDHGAAEEMGHRPGPFVALAAPVKGTPWKLAPDGEGYVTLSFLHSDRWGQARAYAVKPIARYHALLAGAGHGVQQRAEALVVEDELVDVLDDEKKVIGKVFARPIGVAIAVSPRTERIEAPVILGARIPRDDQGRPETTACVQIVVARHGEESLASSNRPLFARLGLPTSLIAFSRAYRTPHWPDRLTESEFKISKPNPLPLREVDLSIAPPVKDATQITGEMVGAIAREYPSLWKGADIWRIAPIPPHYKLIALASARAGIVVSGVTTVVQDDLPRQPLHGRGDSLFSPGPGLEIERVDGDVALRFSMRLLSHEDLTPKEARGWLRHGKSADVGWWPDPDVVYVLLRHGAVGDSDVEEEDAEIRLVAQTDEPPKPGDLPKPVVVRARGPRYDTASAKQLVLAEKEVGDRRDFSLKTALVLRQPTDLQVDSIKLRADEWGDEGTIKHFNAAAATFATILTPHALKIDLPTLGQTAAEYREHLVRFHEGLRDGLKAKLPQFRNGHWGTGVPAALDAFIVGLGAWIDANEPFPDDAPAEDLRKSAGLPLPTKDQLPLGWPLGVPLPKLIEDEVAQLALDPVARDDKASVFLRVWDAAATAEVEAASMGGPTVAGKGGRLRPMLARRLMGTATAFLLRAVDGRARIFNDTGMVITPPPGVAQTTVELPQWLSEALKREAP